MLTGPPSVTGFAGGRPAVEEIVAYWPALIDRREIEPFVKVEILELTEPDAEEPDCVDGASRSAAPVQLRYPAHARSGDKGDTANVGLIALEPEYYPSCVRRSPRRGWPGTSRAW